MQTEALLTLASSGDIEALEGQWMALLEADSTVPETVLELLPVLERLIEAGRSSEAGTLAWTAIEILSDRFGAPGALKVAGPILLRFNDNQELRAQVAELYRQAYSHHNGIDRLIDAAGIAGGRPVRRALRTLDVCLGTDPGSFLAPRGEGPVGQLVAVDGDSWRFRLRFGEGEQELGPIELADGYVPVERDDFRVLRDSLPQRLAELIEKDPAGVVISILKARAKTIDGDALEAMLCPSLVEPEHWKKWWTRARTALKRSPYVEIEGRSPYYLTYRQIPRTLEDETRERFGKLHDAQELLAATEGYLRECRARKQ
ncbi:MAG: hypothetical protein ACYSUQ_13725, partial [Planctomycetota bacterium]